MIRFSPENWARFDTIVYVHPVDKFKKVKV